ncbi:BON domain-containing protein [Rhodopirellula sp. MGV]|uniref:BON domain-containing protein n=1 Tax=Rhodopirellula sp. MGV TaxID=2023130 RepID=UPI00396572B3
MIPNPTIDDICRKIETSVQRVASITELRCTNEDGKFVLHGRASSREEALLAGVAARLVPGVQTISSELKVSRS